MDQQASEILTAGEVADLFHGVRDKGELPGVEILEPLEPDDAWTKAPVVMVCYAEWAEGNDGFELSVLVQTLGAGLLRLFDLVIAHAHMREAAEVLDELQDELNADAADYLGVDETTVRLCVAAGLVDAMDGTVECEPGMTLRADLHEASRGEVNKPRNSYGVPLDGDLLEIKTFLEDHGYSVRLDPARIEHWSEMIERGLRLDAWLCYVMQTGERFVTYCGHKPYTALESMGAASVLGMYGDYCVVPAVILAPDRTSALETWGKWTGLPVVAPPTTNRGAPARVGRAGGLFGAALPSPVTWGADVPVVPAHNGAPSRIAVRRGRPHNGGAPHPGFLVHVTDDDPLGDKVLYTVYDAAGTEILTGPWGDVRRYLLANAHESAALVTVDGQLDQLNPEDPRAPRDMTVSGRRSRQPLVPDVP